MDPPPPSLRRGGTRIDTNNLAFDYSAHNEGAKPIAAILRGQGSISLSCVARARAPLIDRPIRVHWRPFASIRGRPLSAVVPCRSLRLGLQVKSAGTNIDNCLVGPEKIFSNNPAERMAEPGLQVRNGRELHHSTADILSA
jgi:hypothetical protein